MISLIKVQPSGLTFTLRRSIFTVLYYQVKSSALLKGVDMSEYVKVPQEKLREMDNLWHTALELELPVNVIFDEAGVVVMGDRLMDKQLASSGDRYASLYSKVRREQVTHEDYENIERMMTALTQAIAGASTQE
jgi:hypothetical protein